MEEIIDFSGIGEFVESPVKVYSSGMFLRLGFAIAVKMDPEILVVDEIIAVGDEQFQRKCTDYLYKLRQDGCTIVVVSHAMSQIEDMCDNAVWLSHGQVQSLGPARETVQKYLDSVNSEEIANQVETANVVTGDGRATGSGEIRLQQIEFVDADGAQEECCSPTARHHPAALPCRCRPAAGGVRLPLPHRGRGERGRAQLHARTLRPHPARRRRGRVPDTLNAVAQRHLPVTTMISDRSHVFDYRDKQARVTIRSTDQSYAGTAAIDGRWSITPG